MAQRISGFARKDADLYQTPAHVVDALLSVVRINGPVFEPACGEGQICAALKSHGIEAIGSDVNDYGSLHQGLIADFRDLRIGHVYSRCILTNPPYGQGGKLAIAFIEHALELMRPVKGQVWMLLPSDYDHAKTRRHLFAEHSAFAHRVVLHRRIKWFDDPDCKSTPSQNHAWFGWDFMPHGAPVVLYAGDPVRGVAA